MRTGDQATVDAHSEPTRSVGEPHGAALRAASGPDSCARLGELLHCGRARAVTQECARRLAAGLPVAVIIEGEQGTGKSALLEAMAAGCGAEVVLKARCHDAERGFGFGVAGQLLDRITAAGLGEPAPPLAAAELEYDLFNRSYRVIRAVAAERPVVLAIDDVHLADPPSARWLSYLARRLDDLPAGVLVSTGAALRADSAVAELVANLGALAHGKIVHTAPLCADCAGALLARRLGRAVAPALARQCQSLTKGNPQVLGVVAARLAAEAGPGPAIELAARALARTALGWLRRDEPVKAGVVEQFAVCGCDRLETAAMLAGHGDDVARAARMTMRRLGLLAAGPPDRFAHAAIGEMIAGLVPPQQRAAMHAHAATVFSQVGAPALLAAEHAMLAGTIGQPWVRPLLRQAARQAAAAGDWPRGSRFLSRALLEPGPPAQTLAITAELGALEFHHDVDACLRRAASAADLAADDPRSAGALGIFANAALAAEDGDVGALFCRAAGAVAQTSERGSLFPLAAAVVLSGHALPPDQAAGARRAVRQLSGGQRDVAARQLLSALAIAAAARGRGRRRCTVLAQRAAAGGPVRFTDPVPSAAVAAALALAWAGELDRASDTCAQAVEAGRRMTSQTGEALALFVRSEIASQRGNLTAALNDAHQAAQLFGAVGATGLQAAATATLIRVRLLRGEPGAAPGQPTGPAIRPSAHPYLVAMQHEAEGMLAAAQGNRVLALRLYLETGRHLMASGLLNPACSGWRGRAAVVLAGLGRSWEAQTLAATEVRLARSWGAPGPLGRALVAAAATHDGAARRDMLVEAVAVLEDSDCLLYLARALVRLGCDVLSDATGPSRTARDLLERGLDLARECGAGALAGTAHRAMHAAGARTRPHQATTTLTAAERRVAELVISGMSNQAVATALTLSKRTVDTHLGRIYRKLGITGRARLREAVAGAAIGATEAG